MSTKPDIDNRLSELARLDALETSTWPDRIARALRTMDDTQSPLHVASDIPGGSSDDSVIQQSRDMRTALADRTDLIRLVVEREQRARGITRILNDWAPLIVKGGPGDTENSAIWCPNHLKHGHREPAAANGRRNCRWCCDWKERLDWPNKEMIELHARGIKITETIARRSLRKGAA